MNLFDATLDLARHAQGIETHKITGVNGSQKFTCSTLGARMGEYTGGGTCWFLSGDSKGLFGTIRRAKDQYVELESPTSEGFAVGDSVALSWTHYFNTQNLVNAINHVLYDYPIMDICEDVTEEPTTYQHNQFEYELPEEVTNDIRRVEIQCKNWHLLWPSAMPDSFAICHYWHLNGRTLVIDPRFIYKWGGRMRIHYVKEHGMILEPETELISEQVDKTYLRKMANVWLWQHEIQMKHKDNPIAVDMYNQAKMDEDNLNKKNIPENNLLQKDLCYFW